MLARQNRVKMPAHMSPPLVIRMTLATGLCLAVHGCDKVDGGAVELSWKLRPSSSSDDDKFVECRSNRLFTNPVTGIRLAWQVGDQTGFDEWPCTDNHGTTGFDLPEGNALLTITPICAFGPALSESYIAPAAEQRNVIIGDTVSLGAVEFVVKVTSCDDDCICAVPAATVSI